MVLTKDEVDAKAVLIAAMKEAGVDFYKTADGMECSLTSVDNVKVKGAKDDDGE